MASPSLERRADLNADGLRSFDFIEFYDFDA